MTDNRLTKGLQKSMVGLLLGCIALMGSNSLATDPPVEKPAAVPAPKLIAIPITVKENLTGKCANTPQLSIVLQILATYTDGSTQPNQAWETTIPLGELPEVAPHATETEIKAAVFVDSNQLPQNTSTLKIVPAMISINQKPANKVELHGYRGQWRISTVNSFFDKFTAACYTMTATVPTNNAEKVPSTAKTAVEREIEKRRIQRQKQRSSMAKAVDVDGFDAWLGPYTYHYHTDYFSGEIVETKSYIGGMW